MYRRLRRQTLTLWMAIALSFAVTVLSLLILLVFDVPLDTALGIAGLVFGLCTFVLTELRNRDSPRKLIYYIGLDDQVFNANIIEGLREQLADGMPNTLKILAPPPGHSSSFLDWQELQLGLSELRNAAAVVVAPGDDNEQVWEAILRLMKKGVFIVVLDTQPPAAFFTERAAMLPAYVASDFRVGGEAVGALIANHVKSHENASAVICLGPDGNLAGATRSSWVLYALARDGILARGIGHPFPSWDLSQIVPPLVRLIETELKTSGAVIAYCGDDRVMLEVDKHFRGDFNSLRSRLFLIGYDGIISNTGQLVAQDCAFAIATVDTRPKAQGEAAAEILRDIYEGKKNEGALQRIVAPTLKELSVTQAMVEVQNA